MVGTYNSQIVIKISTLVVRTAGFFFLSELFKKTIAFILKYNMCVAFYL